MLVENGDFGGGGRRGCLFRLVGDRAVAGEHRRDGDTQREKRGCRHRCPLIPAHAASSDVSEGHTQQARELALVPCGVTPHSRAGSPRRPSHESPERRACASRRIDDGNRIAAHPRRVERQGAVVTPHPQIDARCSELQVAQRHLVEEWRQAWIAQMDLAPSWVEFQAERSFKQGERRSARPGLRRAGHGVDGRPVAVLLRKTAEQLRQPAVVQVVRGAEQAVEQALDGLFVSVAREPERNQRIVVWPDRAIVVRMGL